MRWVADQLGHADPALTLLVYAHVIPNDEQDLSFVDFGGPGRLYTALAIRRSVKMKMPAPQQPEVKKESLG